MPVMDGCAMCNFISSALVIQPREVDGCRQLQLLGASERIVLPARVLCKPGSLHDKDLIAAIRSIKFQGN